MIQMRNQSCLMNIKSKLKLLTEAESKVANYVLENYMSILNFTVTELAEKSNSSDATVVRFCRSVGYKGYNEFKINLAQDAIVPYKHLNSELEEGDTPAEIINKVIRSEIAVLEETLNILDDKALGKAAEFISKANKVALFGCGGSSIVGLDAMHKFLKIGVHCIAQMDVDVQAMQAGLLSEGDVCIAISHSGTNRNVIDCLKLAKQSGVTTIGLTTQGKSPIQKNCDIVLITSTKETVFKSESVTARIAQLSVIDSLVAAVSLLNYEGSYEAIQKTRKATANRKY